MSTTAMSPHNDVDAAVKWMAPPPRARRARAAPMLLLLLYPPLPMCGTASESYCGKSLSDANENCHQICVDGMDEECTNLGEEYACFFHTGCGTFVDIQEIQAPDASGDGGLQGSTWDRPTQSPTALGLQGGALWEHPTRSPTESPADMLMRSPTSSPSSHPTLGGRQWTVRGQAWYDRNENGIRDSDVAVDGFGRDVEFTHGLGGVNLQLVQCDNATGRAYVTQEGETPPSFAGGRTQGVDVQGKARIGSQLGKFEIDLTQGQALGRYYYLQAQVPSNTDRKFFFTAGVCNDSVPGWGCDYPDQPAPAPPVNTIVPVGISEGRTRGCVFVDNSDNVDQLVNFGIGREGDTKESRVDFALVLQFDRSLLAGGRRLGDLLGRPKATKLQENGRHVATRYLLGEWESIKSDPQRGCMPTHMHTVDIGIVTAEVLAGALDARMVENPIKLNCIKLDSVSPKSVFLHKKHSQLAVTMEAMVQHSPPPREWRMGHPLPPPYIDVDYAVQDFINRDSSTIHRDLREHNKNCNHQRTKVRDEGYGEDDFEAVVSMCGVSKRTYGTGQRYPPGRPEEDLATTDNVFSAACSADILLPAYFETSLKEVRASDWEFDERLWDEVLAINWDEVLTINVSADRSVAHMPGIQWSLCVTTVLSSLWTRKN